MELRHHYVGLTDAQVLESRAKNGTNILTPREKESLWKRFLEKFTDPLIIILLIAGFLSIGISCYEYWGLGKEYTVFFEPIGIFIAILLATGIAFVFELKADKEFAMLNQVNDDELIEVIRNGNTTQVLKKDIVVGDVVLFNTGDEIPADGKLLEAVSLNMDESTLTGEPICHKSIHLADFDKNATYPTNQVMRGTKVLDGHGIMEVLNVGDNTENGKVYEAAQIDSSIKTPLNEQLDGLSEWITKASYIFAVLIIIGRIIMYFVFSTSAFVFVDFITYILQTLMIAVTLIVVAVPEGLPMAVSLSLAYSMRRMIKTNNLVRKMHACETMGAATVICTDKTGTLTQNQMQVYKTNFYSLKGQKLGDDEFSKLIVESIALNTTAQLDVSDVNKIKVLGNPTEGALLLWLRKNGIDYIKVREENEVLDELPFSTERKYMATVVRLQSGKKILFVKGAPEILYSICKKTSGDITKTDIENQLKEYQHQAMRTLGFAYQLIDDGNKTFNSETIDADNLTFMGIVAISDPVREDVPDAVKECLDAGIKIKIVTGDTRDTAKEIGKQVGIWTNSDTDQGIITGSELSLLSEEELKQQVDKFKIIARARPMDKKRIVEALQSNNEVVAVTGDGTNDAPALHTAQVGLSMGDGTSVAKEASDITIIDNSFSSIGRAVLWGRSLYQNIQRFLLFQLTVNVAACFLVLAGSFMGTDAPLTVTQMLWVNLIMDTFGAMALSSLPPSNKVMQNKPRDRHAFIINKPMAQNILGVGGFFFILLLVILYICEHADITCMKDFITTSVGARNGLTPYEHTLIFSIFVMTHFWYMFNARAFETGQSAFHFKGCNGFGLISLIIVVGQILIVEVLYNFFNVVPMKIEDWIIIVILSSLVLFVREGWLSILSIPP
jgi:Ca2+-transporting ATPase